MDLSGDMIISRYSSIEWIFDRSDDDIGTLLLEIVIWTHTLESTRYIAVCLNPRIIEEAYTPNRSECMKRDITQVWYPLGRDIDTPMFIKKIDDGRKRTSVIFFFFCFGSSDTHDIIIRVFSIESLRNLGTSDVCSTDKKHIWFLHRNT